MLGFYNIVDILKIFVPAGIVLVAGLYGKPDNLHIIFRGRFHYAAHHETVIILIFKDG
jgi:hypothetical protein